MERIAVAVRGGREVARQAWGWLGQKTRKHAALRWGLGVSAGVLGVFLLASIAMTWAFPAWIGAKGPFVLLPGHPPCSPSVGWVSLGWTSTRLHGVRCVAADAETLSLDVKTVVVPHGLAWTLAWHADGDGAGTGDAAEMPGAVASDDRGEDGPGLRVIAPTLRIRLDVEALQAKLLSEDGQVRQDDEAKQNETAGQQAQQVEDVEAQRNPETGEAQGVPQPQSVEQGRGSPEARVGPRGLVKQLLRTFRVERGALIAQVGETQLVDEAEAPRNASMWEARDVDVTRKGAKVTMRVGEASWRAEGVDVSLWDGWLQLRRWRGEDAPALPWRLSRGGVGASVWRVAGRDEKETDPGVSAEEGEGAEEDHPEEGQARAYAHARGDSAGRGPSSVEASASGQASSGPGTDARRADGGHREDRGEDESEEGGADGEAHARALDGWSKLVHGKALPLLKDHLETEASFAWKNAWLVPFEESERSRTLRKTMHNASARGRAATQADRVTGEDEAVDRRPDGTPAKPRDIRWSAVWKRLPGGDAGDESLRMHMKVRAKRWRGDEASRVTMMVEDAPMRVRGDARIVGLPLTVLVPVLSFLPWENPEDGTVSARFRFRGQGLGKLMATGRARVEGMRFASPRLAAEPLSGMTVDCAWDATLHPRQARLVIDSLKLRLDHDGQAQHGAAQGQAARGSQARQEAERQADASSEWTGDQAARASLDGLDAPHMVLRGSLGFVGKSLRAADLEVEVPHLPCAEIVRLPPSPLLGALRGVSLDGLFHARAALRIDRRALDETALSFQVQDRCRFLAMPSKFDTRRFQSAFQHAIPRHDGSEATIVLGPGSGNWTPLASISPFLLHAVLAHEDGAFFRHKGFATWAIRDALVENLREGSFVRGASTVSMQLAKNLFLARNKTLSRKVQEVILTWWLERTLSKRALYELYLNVIEYGPNVYGIRAAAQHYFGVAPSQLSPVQATFLAVLLPSPSRYDAQRMRDRLSPSTARRIASLLQHMHARGRIAASVIDAGLQELQAFSFSRPFFSGETLSVLQGQVSSIDASPEEAMQQVSVSEEAAGGHAEHRATVERPSIAR